MPPAGLQWKLKNAQYQLKPIGHRSALFLANLGGEVPGAWVEGAINGTPIDTPILLKGPEQLPKSAGEAEKYNTKLHSAILPAQWLKPGLTLRVGAPNRGLSRPIEVEVGLDAELRLRTLPMYLYGANEKNTFALKDTAQPNEEAVKEMHTIWPVSRLDSKNHAARAITWPYVVAEPRLGNTGYVIHTREDEKDGFDTMFSSLRILTALRQANGEERLNVAYYAPLMMLKKGSYSEPGGGLGGGSTGSGDHRYTAVFIHEMGHALGIHGHAGDEYKEGIFPYIGGSMLGSRWGYDGNRNELVAPWIDKSNKHFATCHQRSDIQKFEGRCYKQDSMQGGGDQQPAKYRFQMHADANAGRIQTHYLEGVAKLDNGKYVYDGGKIYPDSSFPSGYSRWNSILRKRVEVPMEPENYGSEGLNNGLPYKTNVPVHTIVATKSLTGTPGMTQIYPFLSYQGNLVKNIDPTDDAQRSTIDVDKGIYRNYCAVWGCDHTLRVTYASNRVIHVLLRSGGGRRFYAPTKPPVASSTDPKNIDSYAIWGVNVPGDEPLAKVELLETPMAWKGLPAKPNVIASRQR